MVQAARSGKQNIVEGAMAAAVSSETELLLTNVALASLEELREDYSDYLKTHAGAIWERDSKEAVFTRNLCRKADASYGNVYGPIIETRPDFVVANILICLICQTTFLISRQIKAQEQKFLLKGSVREQLSRARRAYRKQASSQASQDSPTSH
jgi:four helix bundle suffix protein